MRTIFLAAIGAAAFAGLAGAQDNQHRDLTGFDTVNAGGGYRLVVTVGEDWSVRLEGDAEDFDKLQSSVTGGELRMRQHQRMFHHSGDLDVTVYVTMPSASEFDFNRGITAEVTGIAADSLTVDVSTGASVSLTGSCGTGEFDLSTGSDLNARELVCQAVEAAASTGAAGRVHATESAIGRASTGASIRIYGQPAHREGRSSLGGDIYFSQGD